MAAISIKDLTVIAIYVDTYADSSLRKLAGPEEDVKSLRRLLVERKSTALLKPQQFIELANPSADEIRKVIDDYALGRSAKGDVCLVYFSGHGVSIGNDDFGFCSTDSRIHTGSHSALPLSVVKFSEVMRTFNLAGVFPIFVIDACFSGLVRKSPLIKPDKAFEGIRQITVGTTSSYCLLCSCSDEETTKDTKFGGEFSLELYQVASKGLNDRKKYLNLKDIYPILVENSRINSGEVSPLIQLGLGMPDVPFVKNVKYKAQYVSFSPSYKCIVKFLWNRGKPNEMALDELGKRCGRGVYSNHSKLSYRPWRLVEDVPGTKGRKRRLTKRGKSFVQGKTRIPKKIVKDPETGNWKASFGSKKVLYDEV